MKQKIIIALSGNPNAGKTTVFNAITGARQHIANYPGVTVEKKYGVVKHKGCEIEVVDLPGTYSLAAENIEPKAQHNETLLEVARAAVWLERENVETAPSEIEEKFLEPGARFLKYRQQMTNIDALQQQTALKRTIAGWMGTKLEYITRPLGFEYRTNIALVGGFAAKEVVISTLGTAYSLSDVDVDKADSLSEKLKKDPAWNPLQAFTLIIFTMLYVPCVATVVSIRKESSWKWAAFSIFFNLVVAYGVSLIIRQGGVFLGLGG